MSLVYRLKLLHPSAPVGLSHVNVTLGIDSQRVGVGKFAELMTRASEAGEDFATGRSRIFTCSSPPSATYMYFCSRSAENLTHQVVPQVSGRLRPLLIQIFFLNCPVLSNT